jgi:hypothetical protein
MQAVAVVSLMSGLLHRWPFDFGQLRWITPEVSMQAVVVVSLMSGLPHLRPLDFGQLRWVAPEVSVKTVVVVLLVLCLGGLGGRLERNQQIDIEKQKGKNELLHKTPQKSDKPAFTFLLDALN